MTSCVQLLGDELKRVVLSYVRDWGVMTELKSVDVHLSPVTGHELKFHFRIVVGFAGAVMSNYPFVVSREIFGGKLIVFPAMTTGRPDDLFAWEAGEIDEGSKGVSSNVKEAFDAVFKALDDYLAKDEALAGVLPMQSLAGAEIEKFEYVNCKDVPRVCLCFTELVYANGVTVVCENVVRVEEYPAGNYHPIPGVGHKVFIDQVGYVVESVCHSLGSAGQSARWVDVQVVKSSS